MASDPQDVHGTTPLERLMHMNAVDAYHEDPGRKISPEEAELEVRYHDDCQPWFRSNLWYEGSNIRQSLFEQHDLLVAIIDRFEQTIRSRWSKKTRKQRQAILLQVWPNMSPNHRPDFEALRVESEQQRTTATQFREAFLWPFINQQDLLDRSGKNLLRLLNSRARNSLDTFRRMDLENVRVGDEHGALNSIVLPPGYWSDVRLCTPQHYCKIEKFGLFDSAWTSQDRISPGDGLDVLIIQERILRFLISICDAVLHEIKLEKLDQPIMPEPEKIKIEDDEWQSFTALSTIAPYLRPESPSLTQVHDLVTSRLAASHDHLQSLREDPAYFVETVQDIANHNPTHIADRWGKRAPGHLLAIRWETVIQGVVGNSFEATYWWSYLFNLFKELLNLERIYVDKKLSREEELPAYLEVLQKIKWILQYPLTNIYFSVARQYFTASEPLRSLFVRDQDQIVLREGGKAKDTKDYLLWLLVRLSDQNAANQHGINNLTVEIDRLVSSSKDHKKQKSDEKSLPDNKRVTSLVAATISDLGLVWEIHNHMARYRPRIFAWKRFDRDLEEKAKDRIEEWGNSLLEPPNQWRLAMVNFRNRVQELPQKDGLLPYPSDRKRSQSHVEQMQRAERNLDRLWAMVDEYMRDSLLLDDYLIFKAELPLQEGLARTEDWISPASRKPNVETLGQDVRNLDLEREFLTEQTVSAPSKSTIKRKNKAKRKATPQFEDVGPAAGTAALAPEEAFAPPTPTPSTPAPIYWLKRKSLNVFKTLFHNPDMIGNQISWTDFVQAMINLGFAAEKLFGSVWRFTPTNVSVDSPILFHEPHPDPTMPYTLARRFGRRLNRAYNWEGWMFGEEK